jgi:hypothetical protein
MKSVFNFWFDGNKWWITGAGQMKFWIEVRTSVIKLPTKCVFNVVRKSKITKARLLEIMFTVKLCRALTLACESLTLVCESLTVVCESLTVACESLTESSSLILFGLRRSSNLWMKHEVSEVGYASVFTQGNRLVCLDPLDRAVLSHWASSKFRRWTKSKKDYQ